MRLLPRSEVKKDKNIAITEASKSRRLLNDEITKLTKELNKTRDLVEKEKSYLNEDLDIYRQDVAARKAALGGSIALLERQKQKIEESIEYMDLEKRRVEVHERELLVKKKFDELVQQESRNSSWEAANRKKEEMLMASEEQLVERSRLIQAREDAVELRNQCLLAAESVLKEKEARWNKDYTGKVQNLLLREHDLDLKELQLNSLREVYEEELKRPKELPPPTIKYITFTTSQQ